MLSTSLNNFLRAVIYRSTLSLLVANYILGLRAIKVAGDSYNWTFEATTGK